MNKLNLVSILCIFFIGEVSGQEIRNFGIDPSNNGDRIHLSAMPDKNNQKIMLQWSCTVETSDNFFTIERSVDGKTFEVIGVIKLKASYSSFTDEKPGLLRLYYRIKAASPSGDIIYSRVVTIGLSTLSSVKFYPNPVQKVLIVRTEAPVELRINDATGKLRLQRQIASGVQLLDVSAMEKGLYIITLYQKDSNSIITEKLLKE